MIFALMILVEIGPELQAKLAQVGDDAVLHVYTVMAKQPDHRFARGLSSIKARAQYYRSVAAEARRLLVRDIESGKIKVERYYASWINNSVELWIRKSEIKKLLDKNDIVMVELVPAIKVSRPKPLPDISNPVLNSSLWNIHLVGVDTVWVRLGLDGSGVLVASMDSGIDTTHPALQGKVIKMRDFTSEGTDDRNGHGTHTAGTIVGGNGYSDNDISPYDIGVAPGARLIHAKILDSTGYGRYFIPAFDWIADLKVDSGYDIKVVNNSWGNTNSTNTFYWNAVMTWRNLGIFPVFAIGNGGPESGTTWTPGNFPTVIGVGATNSSDVIADFSSRGPAPDRYPWKNPSYWYIPDWNLIKPDISAPGDGILSSVPGGGYAEWYGTSMAAPHVTGAVAILLQANPSLTLEQIYRILINTAYRRADVVYPNNDYGWGRLDILEAVLSLRSPLLTKGDISADYGELWDPGETMTFDVQLINIGSRDALNVQGSISTTSSDVTVIDADATWPDIPAGDSAYSNDGGFTVQASSSAGDGTNVSFQLVVSYEDDSSNTYVDTFYVSFTIGQPSYLVYDVDAGNLIVSISSVGAFPSSLQLGSAPDYGYGFVFNGYEHLYYGSFALGKSLNDVSDMWYGMSSRYDADFYDVSSIHVVGAPYYANFKATAEFYDVADVKVIQDVLTLENVDNAIFLRYWITNASSSSISNLYAGLLMDFDIAPYPSRNTGGVDESRNLVYLTYGGIYAGAVYIGSNRGIPISNLTHMDNYTYVYRGTPDSIKYKFLSGELAVSADTGADYSLVISAGPFDLSANASDTVVLTFGLIGANSLSQLQETADTLISRIPVAAGERAVAGVFYLAPVYGNGSISIRMNIPSGGNLRLSLFDISGRKVATLYRGFMRRGSYTIDVTGRLSKGVYILKADTDFGSIKKPIIVY